MNNYMERRFRKLILNPLLSKVRKGSGTAKLLLQGKWGVDMDYIPGYDDGEGPKEYNNYGD